MKVSIGIALLIALTNLVIGVVVFALSVPSTPLKFESMTDTQKNYFVPSGSATASASDYKVNLVALF